MYNYILYSGYFWTKRSFHKIVKICIWARLNLMFQAHVTKPCLVLIMELECRLESAVREYHIYQTVGILLSKKLYLV